MVLWGLGIALQDALLKAMLSGVVSAGRRGTAFRLIRYGFWLCVVYRKRGDGDLIRTLDSGPGRLLGRVAARRHTGLVPPRTAQGKIAIVTFSHALPDIVFLEEITSVHPVASTS